MKNNWRQIVRWGALIISLLALLTAAGLYIVQRQLNLALEICLGIFVIGLAVFVAMDPGAVRKGLTGRQAKYGSNALILSIAFLGILVVINFLVYKNSKRWDLTENQSNTLAKETVDVLKSLPDKVVAKAFFTSSSSVSSSKESAKNLLDQYVYDGGGKFQYEFIDPNKDPTSATGAGITQDGTVVLYLGSSKQPVTSIDEADITGAMVRLMNPGSHVVYFLTGHGEFPLDGSGDQTYSQLKAALEAKNYTVSSLNLLSTNQIPSDANVIVVAGPMKPLSDAEVSLLNTFMKNGGSMVVMEEPTVVTQYGDSPDPLANDIAQTYGIVLGNDVVVDLQANQIYQQPFLAIANQYGQHAITQKMNGMGTFFPTARSVTINQSASADYTRTLLIMTAQQSWAEMDMETVKAGTMKPDQGVDMFGPVSIAAVAEGTSNNSRLVVFGDSDFALNGNYGTYGNGELIVNSIDWAAKQENLISLTPKTTVQRTLVQPKSYTMGLILLGSLIVLPGIILVSGVGMWIARRRQG
jgi:ABC-type uncharacterized transport system involved in gliding motility auxiliary subunit